MQFYYKEISVYQCFFVHLNKYKRREDAEHAGGVTEGGRDVSNNERKGTGKGIDRQ